MGESLVYNVVVIIEWSYKNFRPLTHSSLEVLYPKIYSYRRCIFGNLEMRP